MHVALDMGSKVVTALSTDDPKNKKLERFNHDLKDTLIGGEEFFDSPGFEEFLEKLIILQSKFRKVDEPLFLHSVATGSFGTFNETTPGALSIELMKRLEGVLDFFPLIPDSKPKRYFTSHFASTIELAVCSNRSATSEFLKGNLGLIIVLRGSRTSFIRPSEKLGDEPSSSALEAESFTMQGAPQVKGFSFKNYSEEIIKEIEALCESTNWMGSILNSDSHVPIIVGKGARELLKIKSPTFFDPSFRDAKNKREKIKVCKKDIQDLYKDLKLKLNKCKDEEERKNIFRAIKTLAFINAIFKMTKKSEVYLSDARYIYGLTSVFENNNSTNKSLVVQGTSPFFETFGEPNQSLNDALKLLSMLTSSRKNRSSFREIISRLSAQLSSIQHQLAPHQMEATDVFAKNRFPYLSEEDQSLICHGARSLETTPEEPNSLLAWASFNLTALLLENELPEEFGVLRDSKGGLSVQIGNTQRANKLNERIQGKKHAFAQAFEGEAFKFTR